MDNKFRKKPVVIEAVCWNPSESGTLIGGWPKSWKKIAFKWKVGLINLCLFIPTLEGDMTAQKGDWIIKGVKGEFYPCKPDIFKATYEKVTDAH